MALAFHFAQRSRGVGRFAALGDGEQQRVVVHRRIAIAQFAGVFDLDRDAGEFLEEILAEPAVEMIQWGPADFAMNIGHPGEFSHPDVVAAHDKTFKLAVDAGVAARAEIGSSDQTKKYLDMGVRHFSIGTDITILFDFWKREGEGILRALEGE